MVFWTESRVQSYSRSRVTVGREGISRVPGGHSLHAETGGQPPCLPSAGPTPTVTQLRAQGDQVQHGTAEPIQPGHHQHIPVPAGSAAPGPASGERHWRRCRDEPTAPRPVTPVQDRRICAAVASGKWRQVDPWSPSRLVVTGCRQVRCGTILLCRHRGAAVRGVRAPLHAGRHRRDGARVPSAAQLFPGRSAARADRAARPATAEHPRAPTRPR